MKIKVDGKEMEIKPGERFMSCGKEFSLCPGCGRIIRTNGIFKGVHFCA